MRPEISVVIPTYQRRDRLRACLESLERQSLAHAAFEVVVVVDGSTDGTVELLESYRPPFPLRFAFQPNQGLPAARNAGNRLAASEVILCLDDDMIAAPALVEAHLAAHRRTPGCLVQGALRVHPSAVKTPFVAYEDRRLQSYDLRQRSQARVSVQDVAGGNSSLGKELFEKVRGFDEKLRDLSDTDGELAHRLERIGVKIVYAPDALAHLTFVKDLAERLREAYLYGKTYVYVHGGFPETAWLHSPFLHDRCSRARRALRWHLGGRRRTASGLERLERSLAAATASAERLGARSAAEALYRLSIDFHFWKGVREAAGGSIARYVPRGIPILCYHDVSNVRIPAFRPYILPERRFAAQMRWLGRLGFQPIGLDALYDYLRDAAPIPRRPVVITFDDGYKELALTATPLLAQMGFKHTHFLNTARIGGTTAWVDEAPDLAIVSAAEIREMLDRHAGVVDFQAHGHTHRSFSSLTPDDVREEVLRCIEQLARLTGSPVSYLAYPYGDHLPETVETMASLPLRCSFTVDEGLCRPGQPWHALPRVEIFATDSTADFLLKLFFGRSPFASLRRYPFRRKLRSGFAAVAGTPQR